MRLRLTALYGTLFLLSGAALLAITNFVVRHGAQNPSSFIVARLPGGEGISIGAAINGTSGTVPGGATGLPGPGTATSGQLQAQALQLQSQLIHQHNVQLHDLLVFSVVALCVVAAVSIALGWIVAGRFLRPLRTMTAAARDISASNLSARLVLDGPDDELKDLGRTFNELLARLERAFEAQRRFVANASHELRTPLARQRTLAQVALADPDANVDSLRAAHERVLASGAQQERLIETLLTLARGEAGLERRDLVDLAVVADGVLFAPPSDLDALDLQVEASIMPAPLVGDARLVERMVANLVDNAIRHNVRGGRIEVSTGVRSAQAVVSVSNTGPVIPPSALERLFQPFQRMARERTSQGDGMGLGLSIVQAVAAAHRATVRASARADGGLVVEVVFPAVPPTGPAGIEVTGGDRRPRGAAAPVVKAAAGGGGPQPGDGRPVALAPAPVGRWILRRPGG